MNTIEQAREVSASLRVKLARIYLSPERMVEAADTIDALLAELAALKSQEPVAWRTSHGELFSNKSHEKFGMGTEPLFLTAGAQPAPLNEKNAALWLTKNKQEQFDVLTAGAQERKPLSEFHLTCLLRDRDFIQFARAIEEAVWKNNF